jgi:hypothetical protein
MCPDRLPDAAATHGTVLDRIAALPDAPRQDWRLNLFGAQQDLAAVSGSVSGSASTRCTPGASASP